jgi:hypothetical protein
MEDSEVRIQGNMLMEMKKMIMILSVFLAICLKCEAQSFSIDMLKGKTWQAVSGYLGSRYFDWESVFSADSVHNTFTWKANHEQLFGSELIYLSDSLENTFDEARVGKSKVGKYLVCGSKRNYKGKSYIHVITFKIQSLTATQLILKIGDLTIVFKAK